MSDSPEKTYTTQDLLDAFDEWDDTGVFPQRIEEMADAFLKELGLTRPEKAVVCTCRDASSACGACMAGG
jgi:hypothetical protein